MTVESPTGDANTATAKGDGVAAYHTQQMTAAQDTIAHPQTALHSSRLIGVALGILVERHKIAPDEAFAWLARASQATNRKLRDIAGDLVYTEEEPHLTGGAGSARHRSIAPPGRQV